MWYCHHINPRKLAQGFQAASRPSGRATGVKATELSVLPSWVFGQSWASEATSCCVTLCSWNGVVAGRLPNALLLGGAKRALFYFCLWDFWPRASSYPWASLCRPAGRGLLNSASLWEGLAGLVRCNVPWLPRTLAIRPGQKCWGWSVAGWSSSCTWGSEGSQCLVGLRSGGSLSQLVCVFLVFLSFFLLRFTFLFFSKSEVLPLRNSKQPKSSPAGQGNAAPQT